MGRPMSESTQEILDIVRTHGPIDLNGICAKVTLLCDRTEIAAKLFKAKSRGDVLRRPDKTYVINGKNGTAQKPAPEALPPATVERPTAQNLVERHDELRDKFDAQLKAAEAGDKDALDGLADTADALRDAAGRIFASTPPAAPPRTLRDIAAKHTRTPRPQDALVTPDPIETVLRDAVETAQHNLDAFIREAGDLARVMANLMEARDKTVAALNNYRSTTR